MATREGVVVRSMAARLVDWEQSGRGKAKVVLAVSETDLAWFRRLPLGQRLQASLLPLDAADQQPAQTAAAKDALPPAPARPKLEKTIGAASKAAILCKDQLFHGFVNDQFWTTLDSEQAAAEWMRKHCGVGTRADLDREPEANAKFSALVEQFDSWRRQREAGQLVGKLAAKPKEETTT